MNSLFQAGIDIQKFLSTLDRPFCFIGGLAVLRLGNIRMTQDIDLTVFIPFGQEDHFIEQILQNYPARVSDPHVFASKNRVLLINAKNGIPVDISIAGFPFEEQMITRATNFEFAPGIFLKTCSAEDLIVLKAFANRPIDWVDIEGIIFRQKKLNTQQITQQLYPLCELKEDMTILTEVNQLLKKNDK